jgi:membrane protein DedA with SNARE-associated domain
MNLSDLIAEHGDWIYAIAFVWAFFEGETFVLFGGLAAAQGVLDLLILFLSVTVGSFCGDQCWFQLGRRFGPVLLRRFARWRPRVVAPLAWLERYDTWFILSFRFIYGIRNISSFAIGLSAVTWRRFTALNLLGSALWAASFVAAGYFFGGMLGLAVGDLAENLALFMLAGCAVAVIATRISRLRLAKISK